MSIDNPNEYEKAIDDYAAEVRAERECGRRLTLAQHDLDVTKIERTKCWQKIAAYMRDNKIIPGVYRINKGPGLYAEALVIDPEHDEPPLLKMFR